MVSHPQSLTVFVSHSAETGHTVFLLFADSLYFVRFLFLWRCHSLFCTVRFADTVRSQQYYSPVVSVLFVDVWMLKLEHSIHSFFFTVFCSSSLFSTFSFSSLHSSPTTTDGVLSCQTSHHLHVTNHTFFFFLPFFPLPPSLPLVVLLYFSVHFFYFHCKSLLRIELIMGIGLLNC